MAGPGTWLNGLGAALRGTGFATKAIISIVAVAGIVASTTLVYLGREDQVRDAEEAPRSAEEFLTLLDERLGRNGDILHVAFETEGSSDSVEYTLGVEAWFDFREGKALIAYERKWANLDTPERWRELLTGNDVYTFPESTPPSSTRTTAAESRQACIPSPSYLAAILACGVLPGSSDIEADSLELVTGSADAVGVAYEETYAVTTPPDGFAPPTPTPDEGTPTVLAPTEGQVTTKFVFTVEPATMLPLLLDATTTHSERGVLGTSTLDFASELIDRDDFDLSMFDERAQGFRTPDEVEVAMLDEAIPGGQVFWLGRTFDPGGGLPALALTRVEQRMHPQRPELIALDYESGAGDRVTIAVWKDGDWLAFLGMLEDARHQSGGNFVFASDCLKTQEATVNGWRMRVLGGADVQPDFAGGQSPTPTRGPREACPPRDTYMAEVYVSGGYVVTLNAPIALWGPGETYGRFDDPESLIAIAAGLHPRERGE